MSNIVDLKELSSSVDFWGTTTGFNSDRLCEILAFAVNSVEKLEAAELEIEGLKRFQELNLKIKQAMHERFTRAERERDELRAEQAEHDEQIARMESKFSLAKRALDSKTARCEKAEAELRRRNAAAGEPVAWQYRYNDGKVGDWKTVDSESECNHSPCYERRAIYTAALPAVLPYLSDDTLREMVSAYNIANHSIEAYQEMLAAMGRGAQQQKVVELHKRKSTEVISGQRYSYVLLEDLLPELDAANVKYEVKP